MTTPKPVSELHGLVHGVTTLPSEQAMPLYRRPVFFAGVVAVVLVCLNLYFW
jgi:SSS family solute:Na+ symporter